MHRSLPLHDRSAARDVDSRATAALGGDGYALMQRAGEAGWMRLRERWPQARRLLVACGPGNNGGDGYVLARFAQRAGLQVCAIHVDGHVPRTPLAQRACTDYIAAGGAVAVFPETAVRADVVVDAVFGIGLERAPDAQAAALIEAMNAQPAPVFSLDVPSGIDADRGCAPGAAVRASLTLQFILRHAGLYTGDGLEYSGDLELDDLAVDEESLSGSAPCADLAGWETLPAWLAPRRRNSHKGESGRVLCIGGDHGHGGAVLLCAEAALRSGAGLVTVATRALHVPALLARRPEAMAVAAESAADLQVLLGPAHVLAVGPGLGQGEWGRACLQQALGAGRPLVLDADALNLLAEGDLAPVDAVLTPHPGEAGRLLGCDAAAVQSSRLEAAVEIAARRRSVVVLKGAGTVVAAPGRRPCVIAAGNPGMAVGGMGDVLTGVIAAFRAQGMPAFEAACAGALAHSLAADAAASDGQRGLLPSDLWPHLRRLCNPSAGH